MHQFGILSSVGATPKQLKNSVLFEGLCIGIVGIPIGIVIGIGSIRVVLYMVATNFRNILYEEVPLTLSINIPTLVIAAVVSMMTILISAYMPARKAANTPVMESIRQTNEIKIQSKDIKTSKWVERVCGLEGTLALKNFKRNKRRYHSIVLSLSLSVVLFVCGSTFGTHLKQAAKQSVMDGDYDLLFVTEEMEEDEVFRLYDKLRTIDGIDESSYQAILPYSCTVKVGEFSEDYRETMSYHALNETIHLPMDIQFIEDCIYLDFIKSLDLPIDEYTGENAKMITVGKFKKVEDTKDSRKVMTNLFAERFINCTVAPEINHQPQVEQGKKISMLLVDTVPLDALPVHPSEVKPYMFMVVAPYSLKAQFEASGIKQQIGLTFLSENPSPVMAKMESMIQSEGITSDYTLYNVSEIMEQNRNLLFIVNVFTYVFVMMISLIATANVFNTISTNIRLRRRELAMIRSIGMSDHDLQKMMHFECAFYGIKTLIFALPIASICSWLIYQGLIEGGAEIDFIFPWGSIGISSFGVFFIVFITMLYAVRKIQKENIIDGLRDELS